MKLLFASSSLTAGGAERVLTEIVSHLSNCSEYVVTVATLYGREVDFFTLPDNVHRIALNEARDSRSVIHAVRQNIVRVRRLRKVIRDTSPDVIVSFMPEMNVLASLASLGLGRALVVTEHVDPEQWWPALPWRMLRRLTYRFASVLVSVSGGVDGRFDWLPKGKRRVIHNPVNDAWFSVPTECSTRQPVILGMGRLVDQKGFDLLIAAFGKIAPRFKNWKLVILGEGSGRGELECLIVQLGLRDRVELPGHVADPRPWLRRVAIFALSSRYEGFGNVIVEAMACGAPVVSFNCPSGPSEIIQDHVTGRLVPPEDVNALSDSLSELMESPAERARLAEQAYQSAKQRFSTSVIAKHWATLFAQLKRTNRARAMWANR